MAKGAQSMRYAIVVALLLTGCSESATELTAWQKAMRDGSVDAVKATKAVEVKADEAVAILKENTASLTAIKTKLEAIESSFAKSSTGKDGDPASVLSPPESPAKANTQQTPVQVATPGAFRTTSDGTRLRWNIEGNWNPTILETSAHLREHGINTDGMTHQEMAEIHDAIHEGKPVAMKAKAATVVNRGSSCPGGVCPTNTRVRKGLFGWRR